MKGLVLASALMLLCPAALAVGVYVDEDFESYSNTADMQTVWGAAGAGTLDPNFGYMSSQSMAHPGGTNNTIELGADLIPTDTEPVVLRGVVYDDAVSDKRFTIGLRSLSTFPLFEMGRYNSVVGQDYFVRITLFPGLSPGWVDLGLGGAVTGWHTWEATFTGTDITVDVDLNSDGAVDSSTSWALGGAYTAGFGQVRLGGPSSVSSTGGGGNFDDIYLAQVPEPGSLSLLAVGALALLRRR